MEIFEEIVLAKKEGRAVVLATVVETQGSGPRGEEDPVSPLNIYGQSKADAEAAIVKHGGDHLIVGSLQIVREYINYGGFVINNHAADHIYWFNSSLKIISKSSFSLLIFRECLPG